MIQLLLATSNRGKIRELQHLLGASVEVLSLADLGIESPEETGGSFAENAELKARHGAVASGRITVADDSGIEVDALDGAPGIRSARYAGEPADDARNRHRLLRELDGVPQERRTARFVCEIAVASARAGPVDLGTTRCWSCRMAAPLRSFPRSKRTPSATGARPSETRYPISIP